MLISVSEQSPASMFMVQELRQVWRMVRNTGYGRGN